MRIPATVLVGAIAVFLVFGCESAPTRYQRLGSSGDGGYIDKRISEDTFTVKFIANDVTPVRTICRYLYRRAAELTLKNGFTHFAVIRDPCALQDYTPMYRHEDEYRDMMKPTLTRETDSGTWLMTIQCFRVEPEGSKLQPLDAKAYLHQN
jgi:hypothetical protein